MTITKGTAKNLCVALAFIFASVALGFSQEKPLRPLRPDDLFKLEDVGQVALSPDGRWLAYVLKRSKTTALIHTRPFLEGNDRGDIWLVSTSGGQPRNLTRGLSNGSGWWAPLWSPDSRRLTMLSTSNLTAAMKIVPRELIREGQGKSFVGVADGELWRIRLDGADAENLTDGFEPRILSTLWPTISSDDAVAVTQVIVNARTAAVTGWYRIELSSSQITPLTKPNPEATLAGFDSQTGTAILTARDRTGTYLWLSRAPFQQHAKIVEVNTLLREIAQTEFKKIEYRGLDGRELKGWVLLPLDYQRGRRYPLITVVYAGNVFGDNPPGGHARTINNSGSLNYHLLAARGYAVLFPSIPLKPEGEASDPYLELTKGVLPAIDKVIEEKIADPSRLGVMGQSYGGYAVYGLVAQTNRFRSAISLAGLSDLISLYGIFDARFRYDSNAHERLFSMSLAETGQARMGNPPWKDLDRYIRNSPLFQVDKIETPVMIVQGDLDYVAMQQGEQMFSALHRQNKRAAFVRYWGEGHVLESPANIRDLWARIYAWFDQSLRPTITGK